MDGRGPGRWCDRGGGTGRSAGRGPLRPGGPVRTALASSSWSPADDPRARQRLLAVVAAFLRAARFRLRLFLVARLRQEFALSEDRAQALVRVLERRRVIEVVVICHFDPALEDVVAVDGLRPGPGWTR